MSPKRLSPNALSLAILLTLAGGAIAQENRIQNQNEHAIGSVPVTYVGSHGRVGLGVDQDGNVSGEILGIFGRSGVRAFLAEAYHVDGGGSGVKFGYNWLLGGASPQDTRERPQAVTVAKLFGAVDRNVFDDRKATIGVGLEREAGELDLYYSRNLTDERLIAGNLVSDSRFRFFEQDGRQFRQLITTDTITNLLEHPYEHGLGFRLGRFFEGAQLRLRGGLDYERGSALLQNDHASQSGATFGAEKFFANSQHSLALEVSHHRKDGPFDKPQFGGRREDTRATLTWRYDLGKAYRPMQEYRDAEAPVPAAVPQIVRNEVEMNSQELFEFDRAGLTEAARAKLGTLLDTLKNKRAGDVRIVGHTCDLGTDAYNQSLSERRAEAVRSWLVEQGIPADAIRAEGAGEASPRYPNDSEENRAKNRRIELSFLSVEETRVEAPAPQAEVKREPVPTAAPWIERALHNLPTHKREVDTYTVQRVQTRVQEGPVEEITNRVPVANIDAATTQTNTAVNIAVLANDTDPDGDTLALQQPLNVLPAHGTVAFNGDGSVTYTPAADFVGEDNFAYAISDGNGGTAVAGVTVNVQSLASGNNAPTAGADSVSTAFGSPIDIDVLGNDSDPDGDTLTVQAELNAQPANGIATVNDDSSISYAPNEGFVGEDQFAYTVSDGKGGTAIAAVTVTVGEPPNQPPLAFSNSFGFSVNVPTIFNVIADDVDADGPPPRLLSIDPPTVPGVTITQNDDGTLSFLATQDFAPINFSYTIIDEDGATASANVRITRLNEAPIAVDDVAPDMSAGQATSQIFVLDNDTDPDAVDLPNLIVSEVAAFTAPPGVQVPTATISADKKSVFFTRNGGIGDFSFQYAVKDGQGATDVGLVTVHVNPPPPPG